MTTTARIALLGPMGIGKTTAIRTLCGNLAVDCDVPNLDTASHGKAMTTVGADFGEVDFGEGDKLQIYGCPGQERFDFVRKWVLSLSLAALVMTDIEQPGAAETAGQLLREIADSSNSLLSVVLIARPATAEQIDKFSATLEQQGTGLVPVIQADVRDQQQMRDVIQILVSMLSLQDESQ